MFDKESIIPYTITFGVHFTVVINVILFWLALQNKWDIILTFLFGFLASVSSWKLYQFYRWGAWKSLKGLDMNSLIYGGKFKK